MNPWSDAPSLVIAMGILFVVAAYLALDLMNRLLPKPFREVTIVRLAFAFGLTGLITTLLPELRILGAAIAAIGTVVGSVWWFGLRQQVGDNSINQPSSAKAQRILSIPPHGEAMHLLVATSRSTVTPGRYLVSHDNQTWDWAELKVINGHMTHNALPKPVPRDDPLALIALAVVGVAIASTIVLVLLTALL